MLYNESKYNILALVGKANNKGGERNNLMNTNKKQFK